MLSFLLRKVCNKYTSKCKASFKDIDLVWNVPSTCGIFHKGECVMSTSMISCMPLKCSPSDIVLLAEAETEAFCPSMKVSSSIQLP